MIVFCRSFDNTDRFPDNKAYNFFIQLPEPLQTSGQWGCRLLSYSQPDATLRLVLLDVLAESSINQKTLPILRSIDAQKDNCSPSYFIPLKQSHFSQLHFTIVNFNTLTEPTSVADDKTYLVLEFKKL